MVFTRFLLLDEKINDTFNELVKWVDVSDSKVSPVQSQVKPQQVNKALKHVGNIMETKKTRDASGKQGAARVRFLGFFPRPPPPSSQLPDKYREVVSNQSHLQLRLFSKARSLNTIFVAFVLKYRDTGDTQIKYRDLSIYPLLILPGRFCFQVLPFYVRRAEALKLYGMALKASMKQNGDGALRRENDDKRIEVCKFRLSQSVSLYRESCSYWLLNFFFSCLRSSAGITVFDAVKKAS